MRKKYLFIFGVLAANSVCALSPYQQLDTVLPAVDFGWYSNGKYIAWLIHSYAIHTVIEVGSFLGKSTIHIAQRLPHDGKIYAIDHWQGSTEHQSSTSNPFLLDKLYEQFLSNVVHARLTHKIIPIREESLQAAAHSDLTADMIYIDAAHDTESVYKDLNAWFPHLTSGGILCGDDWQWDTVRIVVEHFAAEHPELILHSIDNFYWFLPAPTRRVFAH